MFFSQDKNYCSVHIYLLFVIVVIEGLNIKMQRKMSYKYKILKICNINNAYIHTNISRCVQCRLYILLQQLECPTFLEVSPYPPPPPTPPPPPHWNQWRSFSIYLSIKKKYKASVMPSTHYFKTYIHCIQFLHFILYLRYLLFIHLFPITTTNNN